MFLDLISSVMRGFNSVAQDKIEIDELGNERLTAPVSTVPAGKVRVSDSLSCLMEFNI